MLASLSSVAHRVSGSARPDAPCAIWYPRVRGQQGSGRRAERLRRELVLVDQAAEQVTAADAIKVDHVGHRCSSLGGGSLSGGRCPRARCGRCSL